MPAEQWKPIQDFPHLEVSDLGAVRNAQTKEPVRPEVNTNDYLRLRARRGGVQRRKYVHTAVCEAFHGERPEGMESRHLNGDHRDNRAVNLAWGTRSENMYDRIAHGTHHQVIKTHCPSGHAYNDENTRVIPSRPTARYCIPCQRARQAVAA